MNYYLEVYGFDSKASEPKEVLLDTIEMDGEDQDFDFPVKLKSNENAVALRFRNINAGILNHLWIECDSTKMKHSSNAIQTDRIYLFEREPELKVEVNVYGDTLNMQFDFHVITDTYAEEAMLHTFERVQNPNYLESIRTVDEILTSRTWVAANQAKSIVKRAWNLKNRAVRKAVRLYQNNGNRAGLKSIVTITDEQRQNEENYAFENRPKVSILVPLYNTPELFLKEMIESVRAQTYSNWELVCGDASDSEHAYVKEVTESFNDERIVYFPIENKGISSNTNACFEHSSGDFIALLDHDDLLHPSAVFSVMEKAASENADIVYTDEMTFRGDNLYSIANRHYKPEFALDNLLANNYVCHFLCFKRDLFVKAGKFRDAFNGSQDHDLVLRLTELTDRVSHVPEIRYFWRSHSNSTAQNIGAKSYAVDAGVLAVEDYLKRNNLKGKVESERGYGSIYHVQYEMEEKGLVSVIIPVKQEDFLQFARLLDSVLVRTLYPNFEFVVMSFGSPSASMKARMKYMVDGGKAQLLETDADTPMSKALNEAASKADGKYLLFMEPNMEIITPEWLDEMAMYAQKERVGAVGGKIYRYDGNVDSFGEILGGGDDGIAGGAFAGWDHFNPGAIGRLVYTQDVTLVPGDCLLVRKELFDSLGGFDESYANKYYDVDLCMKLRKKGLWNVVTPWAELSHFDKEEEIDAAADWEKIRTVYAEDLSKADPLYSPHYRRVGDYSYEQ